MNIGDLCLFSMMPKQSSLLSWLLFIALCFIWGSSFILMKKGMTALDAYQVASIRMFSAGLILLPISLQILRKVPRRYFPMILLSGLLGSFFPAFLFCIAETRISSSLAGFLNAFTPLANIAIGYLFFSHRFEKHRLAGVVIGFAGMTILFISGDSFDLNNVWFSGFVVLATICYALNANLVAKHLKEVGSVNIAAIAFVFLLIPSFLALYSTGYFRLPLRDSQVLTSTAAAVTLGVLGTALASILFYMLLKRTGTLFTSMVTYGISFVALFWGLVDNETVTTGELIGLAVVLVGVYITNRKSIRA